MNKVLNRIMILLVVMFVVGFVLSTWTAEAAPGPIEKPNLIVSYCAPTAAQSVVWIVKDSNLFEKYGLNATVQFVATAQQAAAVVGGHVDIAVGPADMVISAVVEGADLMELAILVPYMQGQFHSKPHIKSGADLKGKLVGGLSEAPNIVTACSRYALQKLGLDPTKDVTWRYMDTAAMYAALFSNQIDACPVFPPDTLKAKKLGYNLLYDVVKDNVLWPSLSLYATRNFVAKNRDTVLACTKALVEGIMILKTKPDFSTDVIMKWAKQTDREVAAEGQAVYSRAIPQVPKWTNETMGAVITNLIPIKPKAKELNITKLFDNSFLDELERTGFINKLYGK